MTCHFMSFLTAFQLPLYQDGRGRLVDNERVCAMELCLWLPGAGLELVTARLVGQHFSY